MVVSVSRHYDGLNVLRIDEKYDDDSSSSEEYGLDDDDPWRTIEVNTH